MAKSVASKRAQELREALDGVVLLPGEKAVSLSRRDLLNRYKTDPDFAKVFAASGSALADEGVQIELNDYYVGPTPPDIASTVSLFRTFWFNTSVGDVFVYSGKQTSGESIWTRTVLCIPKLVLNSDGFVIGEIIGPDSEALRSKKQTSQQTSSKGNLAALLDALLKD